MKLEADFYLRTDVTGVARDLLGKVLCTRFGGRLTSGYIVETEAYAGADDSASHAYRLRKTNRNKIMYENGGTAYVYICYGIHHLFNVVTNARDIPHAVLIRAIEPRDGIDTMLERRKKISMDRTLSAGPGTLSEALGITIRNNGLNLLTGPIWIEDVNAIPEQNKVITTPRIGVENAGKDALLPYRYLYKGTFH